MKHAVYLLGMWILAFGSNGCSAAERPHITERSPVGSMPTTDPDPTANQQPKPMAINLTNPTVKAAIDALNAHDRKAWETLFAAGATFSDDGNEGSIANFTANAFGKGQEHFTRLDKQEQDGLHVFGQYHSDTWGDFKTYFKFTVMEGRITRLEVGQANY